MTAGLVDCPVATRVHAGTGTGDRPWGARRRGLAARVHRRSGAFPRIRDDGRWRRGAKLDLGQRSAGSDDDDRSQRQLGRGSRHEVAEGEAPGRRGHARERRHGRAGCRRRRAADDPGASAQLRQQARGTGDGERREERAELGAAPAKRLRERRTRVAAPEVTPNPAVAPHAAVAVGQRPLDSSAHHLTPRLRLVQRQARLVDRLSDGAGRDREHDRDLVVAEAAELAQQQRAALALGQRGEVGAQAGHTLADVERLVRAPGRDPMRLLELAVGSPPAQDVHRLVARDAEQPRPQCGAPVAATQRRPGIHHGLVEGIVRVVVVADDRAAVAQQIGLVALVQRGEGLGVALGGHRAQGRIATPRGLPPARQALDAAHRGRAHARCPFARDECLGGQVRRRDRRALGPRLENWGMEVRKGTGLRRSVSTSVRRHGAARSRARCRRPPRAARAHR
ncbi:MAG TPA: hypothetical protein VHF51_06175 [Solirubrobacteraceae bacterium]|nr:hypothetical protein [Solirubrobacteraceae bacterium]